MLTEERMTFFETQIQDIRDAKANQWRLSNYGVLIQAALVAVDANLESPSILAELILILLSAVTCGAIIYLIYEATTRILYCRSNYKELMADIPMSFVATLARFRRREKLEKPTWPEIRKTGRSFALLFLGVQVIAMGLAMWVILFGGPSIAACLPM